MRVPDGARPAAPTRDCAGHAIQRPLQIVSEPYPDHTAWDKAAKYYDSKSDPENPRWLMVDCRLV